MLDCHVFLVWEGRNADGQIYSHSYCLFLKMPPYLCDVWVYSFPLFTESISQMCGL